MSPISAPLSAFLDAPMNVDTRASRVEAVNARKMQLLNHADMIKRCIARVPRQLRASLTPNELRCLRDLDEHIGHARRILSWEEDGDMDEEVEGGVDVVTLLEHQLMAARDMMTLSDATFGWSLLDLDEDQVFTQVLNFLEEMQ